jgi:hypothetical protein
VCVPAFLHSRAHWSTCFVLPSPNTTTTFFAHPSFRLSLIPVFREICVFWKCVWKCPQDGECGSRVRNNTPPAPPPPRQNPPLPPPDHARFVFE